MYFRYIIYTPIIGVYMIDRNGAEASKLIDWKVMVCTSRFHNALYLVPDLVPNLVPNGVIGYQIGYQILYPTFSSKQLSQNIFSPK